jgi:glycosyltransferase involved in cell wall biosynthesis
MLRPQSTIAFVPREVFSTTPRALEAIYARTDTPFELVCVDGGSPPQIQQYLANSARQRNFTLLRTEQYLTPNQARNLAVQHVSTPYVVFVDNDAIVSHGWLKPLERCANETGAWVVGPLYFEHEPELHRLHMAGGECGIQQDEWGRRFYLERHDHAHQLYHSIDQIWERHETELIEFHTVLVAMAAFQELGPLDEGLFCHCEHGDLSMLVRRAGHTVFLEPQSRITYIPPRRLEAADREFFRLRWSEAWAAASIRRMIEKWDLAADHPEVKASLEWVRDHRRYGSTVLAKLRKLVGRKLTSSLQKRLLNRLEEATNRRHYPPQEFSTLAPQQVKVVFQPVSNIPLAA